MIRRPPRSTLDRSSAASDVYKRQVSGSCIARVSKVGASTEIGKIGHSLENIVKEKTPLQIQIRNFTGKMVIFGVIAVSYTHLRAHETVLDLVCRLLLEKKNKKKTKKKHTNKKKKTNKHSRQQQRQQSTHTFT